MKIWILKSAIWAVSFIDDVSFVWSAWSREEQPSCAAPEGITSPHHRDCGLVILTVPSPLKNYPFLISFLFEIVSNICPVAESCQCKILNE